MLTFNAIDVETANADRVSICQIGIVHVRDGIIKDEWKTLVNPEDWFDPWNISIHGINKTDVKYSPTIPEVSGELNARLRDLVLVSHTSFDRVAFERAMKRYGLEQLQVIWLDSAKVVRRAWPDKYARRGYGLRNVADDLKIDFNHHDALEDAIAAAKIVLSACDFTQMGIEDWIDRCNLPIFPPSPVRSPSRRQRASHLPVNREGNLEGVLFGETVLFTGRLESATRQEAANIAAEAGCNVVDSASKKVTMLVVGIQHESILRGYDKSSKHRKIESLIETGSEIQILSEGDFFELVGIG